MVVGGSGYTGGELLRILCRHPKVDDLKASSRKLAGRKASETHEFLDGAYEGEFIEFSVDDASSFDVVFLAVPHTESMTVTPDILEHGVKSVVDLSADYRLKDAGLYEQVYGVKHSSPDLLEEAVYGLPELYRDKIKKARLIANPGCYPTSALLALRPLEEFKDKIDLGKVVVDSKSGTSGAGAGKPEIVYDPPIQENMKPYKMLSHRHQPEMDAIINEFIPGLKVSFTPTLVPLFRGILSNVHCFGDLGSVDLMEHYREFYKGEPFVEIGDLVYISDVAYTNKCRLGAYTKEGRVLIVSAIDNLTKGASGQAVQNMNIALGFDEETGLENLSKP